MNGKMRGTIYGLMAGLVSRAEFPQGKEPAEQWETLFDGEYDAPGTQFNTVSMGKLYTVLTADDVLRVTVDGEATTEQLTEWNTFLYVGNGWLYAAGIGADNGTDWVVVVSQSTELITNKKYENYMFNHKTAGMHKVKIERLVT